MALGNAQVEIKVLQEEIARKEEEFQKNQLLAMINTQI